MLQTKNNTQCIMFKKKQKTEIVEITSTPRRISLLTIIRLKINAKHAFSTCHVDWMTNNS